MAAPSAFIMSSTNGHKSTHWLWPGATDEQVARALARESDAILRGCADIIPPSEAYVECRTVYREDIGNWQYRLTIRRKP